MRGDLEDCLGCEIDPTLVYDYPKIEALVQHLTSELVNEGIKGTESIVDYRNIFTLL